MSRLDYLPDAALITELNELLRISRELKSAGQRFGSDAVLTNTVQSSATWDITVTGVEFNNRVVEVTYTPDDPPFEGAGIIFDYGLDGVVTGPGVQVFVDSLIPNGSVQKFRVYLNGTDGSPSTVKLKFYFSTIGDGTFSCALV